MAMLNMKLIGEFMTQLETPQAFFSICIQNGRQRPFCFSDLCKKIIWFCNLANMHLIAVFVTKLWPVQAWACGCGGDGGGATKNIIPGKL